MWRKKQIKILTFFLSLVICFFSYCFLVFSEDFNFFSQTAIQVKVDEEVESGDVLVKKEGKLKKAEKPYDKNIFGVVATNPIITLGERIPGTVPVVTQGISIVKVIGEPEPIKEGDYLTSAEKPGFAKKASYPGFVLGKALESFEGKEGKIRAFIYPHYADFEPEKSWTKMSFWEAVGRIISALERDVPSVLRYIFALLVAGGSFLLGFRAFVTSLREGIKGISRNPMAKGSIRFSMILNLIGILILTLAGLAISLFVIMI